MSHKDREHIKNMSRIPSKQTFHRDLKKVDSNLRAHDFRYNMLRTYSMKELVRLVMKEPY